MATGKYRDWLTPEGLEKLEGYASEGLTDEEIAQKVGIKRQTLYDWMNRFNDISVAIKRGKTKPDDEVEQALFKSAKGFEYDEITYERQFNRQTGEFEMVETKRVTKKVPPSNTAQIFWLKNRRPDMWRDKHETAVTVSNAEVIAEMDEYFNDKATGSLATEK